MKKNFGEKIRVLRTMKGYSQQGLARTLGLKQVKISHLECNKIKKDIPLDLIQKLADSFNMPLCSLIDYLSTDQHPAFSGGGRRINSNAKKVFS